MRTVENSSDYIYIKMDSFKLELLSAYSFLDSAWEGFSALLLALTSGVG